MNDISDIIVQQGELARRRKLMEAMQAQNMGTQIQGGGRGNAIGQALAKVATAYLLGQQGNRLAQEETANRTQYQQGLQGELDSYMATRDGQAPQEMPGPMPDGVSPLMSPGTRGNPREAVIRAMASQYPELQAIGKADFSGLRKEQMSTKDWLGFADKYDPESVIAAQQAGDPRLLKPKNEFKEANGQIFNVTGPKPQAVVDARGRFGPTVNVNGEAVQFEEGTNKAHQVANRPANGGTTIVKAANAGLGEWAKLATQSVNEMANQARNSRKVLDQLTTMGKLSSAGTFNGPTANPAVWLGQLMNTVGVPMTPETQAALNNSQTFGNVAAELWLSSMNAAGGARGLVKEESERIANNLPALVQTPEGRKQIISVMAAAHKQQIQDAQQAQKELGAALARQDPQLFTFGLSAAQIPRTAEGGQAPDAVSGSAPGVMSLQDYLKRMQGGQNAGR